MDSATDKQAFLDLIRDNRKIIFKICNSYCPNKIERDDLAQEIVYHLWKSFAHFDPEMKFSTWMYRVALNVAISFYRKEKKSKPQVEFSESLVVFEENPDATSEAEHNLQLLMKFINELREIDKSIMLLYLDEKTYKEIAEITGITESNVATKVNRIKEKLKSNFSTVQNNYYGTK